MFQMLSKDSSSSSNQSNGSFFQPVLQLKEDDKSDCSGWVNDPQSFSIMASEHFLQEEYNITSSPDKVECDPPGSFHSCAVIFVNGVRCTVMWNDTQVSVNISPLSTKKLIPPNRFCKYSFSCNKTGKINFQKINCF